MKTSKPNNDSKQINTVNVSLGAGGALTPYAVPVEGRGGASHSKAMWSTNITQSLQNSYNYVQQKIKEISANINSLTSSPKNNSEKQNKN